MKFFSLSVLSGLFALVAACGGSSSSDPAVSDRDPSPPKNVAAEVNGSVATASYDAGNAGLVTDGDTTTSNFWAGNIQNDYVEVEFDRVYEVVHFVVHTNTLSTADIKVQFSADGANFDDVNLVSDCASLSLGSGKIQCTLSPSLDASHVRVVITAATDVTLRQVYEVEVLGL